MVDIKRLAEQAKGDLNVLYRLLLESNGGDVTKTTKCIDVMLKQAAEEKAEAEALVRSGMNLLNISQGLSNTREIEAYKTQREFYRKLHSTDPAVAWEKYYSSHPQEAEEDNII